MYQEDKKNVKSEVKNGVKGKVKGQAKGQAKSKVKEEMESGMSNMSNSDIIRGTSLAKMLPTLALPLPMLLQLFIQVHLKMQLFYAWME